MIMYIELCAMRMQRLYEGNWPGWPGNVELSDRDTHGSSFFLQWMFEWSMQ